MVNLNGSVRMVIAQFSFSSRSAIPEAVTRSDSETLGQHKERIARRSGVMVIAPTEGCSIVELPQIESEGYQMVKAVCQERIDQKDSQKKRMYWTIQFAFVREEFLDLSDSYFRYKENYLNDDRIALQQMCHAALWRVRIFDNPFYDRKDEEVPGQRALSINLESRQPLQGEHIKVQPKASHIIHVRDHGVELVKA